MKKTALFFSLLFCFTTLFTSCDSKKQVPVSTTHNQLIFEETTTQSQKNDKSEIDAGEATISTRKYRVNYYDVPYQFVLLVGEDNYWDWDEKYLTDNPDDTNVMVMKRFVQFFDISKEDFDKANLEWAKVILSDLGSQPIMNPKDFANQETDEVYNADIIYTFDDEVINEYYLSGYYPYIYESEYEEAVASGEYTSQTEVWIDIEQMEAEIIEKYGEVEIVAETTPAEETSTAAEDTAIPEETTA
ncbi:MAG: hypothetical protein IJO03_09525 [Clostridia bacterium]|nr:hypothetical protein [Clostridia bacterium]